MLKSAMIMAAGIGSRLEPLTKTKPKPLVPIANIPAMDLLLNHISKYGIKKIVANTHCLAEQIETRYKDFDKIKCSFVREETLSGTAGGVKKCEWFFDDAEDLLVMSSDGLTDIDLDKFYESHKKSGAIASIALKKVAKEEVPHFGVIVRDDNGFILEFQEKPKLEEAKSDLVSTGIYMFKKEIFNYIPENTFYDFAKNVFPQIMDEKKPINTFIVEGYWSDIGTLNQYKLSTKDFLENKLSKEYNEFLANLKTTENAKCLIGKNSVIEDGVIFNGCNVIGDNCHIKSGCVLTDSVLWNDITVENNIEVKNCVIANDCSIQKNSENIIVGSNQIIN